MIRRGLSGAAVLCVGAAALVTGCSAHQSGQGSASPAGDKIVMDSAHPTYSSVEQLAGASDAVVLGHLGAPVAHVVDDGGQPQQGKPGGIPMVFNTFTVDQVVRGHVPTHVVTIGRVDLGTVQYEDSTEIAAGAQVLLFLKLRPAAQHTYLKQVPGPFYVVTTSSDNGVFDVRGATALARSLAVRSVSDGSGEAAEQGAKLSVPLETMEAAAKSAPSGASGSR